MKSAITISEGFKGQKAINILWKDRLTDLTQAGNEQLYVTDIGYYPRATNHYRNRSNGCQENILIFCADGRGWINHREKYNYLKENTFYIIPKNEAHCYGSDNQNPWTIYWVHFLGDNHHLISSLSAMVIEINKSLNHKRDSLDIFNNIYQNLSENQSVETLDYINYTFQYFLVTLKYQEKFQKKPDDYDTDLLKKCKQIMQQDLSQKLSVKELAKKIGYSASHFTRIFSERLAMTPMNYYNQIRIEQACNYLLFSNYNIKEIAFKLGYCDQYHFSKSFQKQLGIAPSEYRSKFSQAT